MPLTELGTARQAQVGRIQGSVSGGGCATGSQAWDWAGDESQAAQLVGDVGAVRVEECLNYLDYQGTISCCHRLRATCSGSGLPPALCWEAPNGASLDTDPYFRRGVSQAQQGKVTCPKSHSWLRLSQDPLLCPKTPALPSGCTRSAWAEPVGIQMRL